MGRRLGGHPLVGFRGRPARRSGAARARGRARRAQPRPAAQALRRGGAAGAGGNPFHQRGALQPVPRDLPRVGPTSSLPASAAGARPRSSPAWRCCPALVQQRDDAQSLEAALIENMAREDLNPIEAARAVAAPRGGTGALTRRGRPGVFGSSRVAGSNLLRLLDLPDEALALVELPLAHRGPRCRPAGGRRPRRPPATRPLRRGGGRMVGARRRGRPPRGQLPARASKRGRAPIRPGRGGRGCPHSSRPSVRRSEPTSCVRPVPGRSPARLRGRADEALALARRLRPASGRRSSLESATREGD